MLFELYTSSVSRSLRFWKKYERFFMSGSLLVGFCFDLVIADRPDSALNNTLLLIYLFIAGGLIIALNIHKTRRQEIENPTDPMLILLALQFLFGNLSSNFLVLYGRSGTLAGSAMFLGLLLAMLIGNEFFKTRYGHLRFNVAIYYMLVLSYLVIAVPTFILHDIGTFVFLVSGFVSLVFIGLFLWALYALVFRGKYRKLHLFQVVLNVVLIFGTFNALYFLNIIPPVPLSLKDIGTYHTLVRTGAQYEATYEKPPWFVFWRGTSATYTIEEWRPAYCFSSVFAPTGLSTSIVHAWEYYNEKSKRWEVRSRVSFQISGGRDGGYRGFSTAALIPGKWRCNVQTENGALIGRITFTATEGTPQLSPRTL